MAMQTAIGKERFMYYSFLVSLAFTFLPIFAVVFKKPQMLVPLVPMGFSWTYQYDILYGTLMLRAQKEASRMIREEPERFFLPRGTGIVEQGQYNRIVGLPAGYSPRI